jgi:hypothetical protein
MPEPGLIAALAVIAFLYSVVGHAGASGYIAILALAGQSSDQIKSFSGGMVASFRRLVPSADWFGVVVCRLEAWQLQSGSE